MRYRRLMSLILVQKCTPILNFINSAVQQGRSATGDIPIPKQARQNLSKFPVDFQTLNTLKRAQIL